MNRPLLRTLLPVAAGLALLVGCSTQNALDRSAEFARLAEYDQAYRVLDEEYVRQSRDGTVDERLAEAHERMRRRYLLDRAQARLFLEREDEAERDLDELAAIAPDYPGLADLRRRVHLKQAQRLVLNSDELLAEKDYAGAMEGYREAQRIVPGLETAEKGVEAVGEELARLDVRAQQQFLQAVRKVPEFRWPEVAYHASIVIHNVPDRDGAEDLREQAQHENAERTFAMAKECQDRDQFGAAMVLYKRARQLDPELPGLAEAIAAMDKELAAVVLIEKAAILMRGQKFDEARKTLEQALADSVLSRPAISELMIQNRKLEGMQQYRAARDLEVMGKKQEALDAFQALATAWPDGLEDERARIDSLTIDIDGAKAEWDAAEAAEAAGDLEKALRHYRAADRYYADWRDGKARIARLEKAIAEQKAKAGGDGGDADAGR
ncbi:MAG: hypothetical protein H6835_14925 [Planctomycetes bacterium]|nr:hypothetical protein [Planctomycetota bacterium]